MPMLWSQRRKIQIAAKSYDTVVLERFPAKWRPVRVKKTRQIKNLAFPNPTLDFAMV
jgi:hypothetical protein